MYDIFFLFLLAICGCRYCPLRGSCPSPLFFLPCITASSSRWPRNRKQHQQHQPQVAKTDHDRARVQNSCGIGFLAWPATRLVLLPLFPHSACFASRFFVCRRLAGPVSCCVSRPVGPCLLIDRSGATPKILNRITHRNTPHNNKNTPLPLHAETSTPTSTHTHARTYAPFASTHHGSRYVSSLCLWFQSRLQTSPSSETNTPDTNQLRTKRVAGTCPDLFPFFSLLFSFPLL